MKKITLVLGIVLGLAAMWTATSSGATDEDPLRGGWIWVGPGTCCYGNVDDNCAAAPPFTVCSLSIWVNICNVSGMGGGCVMESAFPCVGDSSCNNAEDTHCSVGW